MYAVNGAVGLDEFLYGITAENPEKMNLLKTMAGSENGHKLLEEYEAHLRERWDAGVRPGVTLSDVVGPEITKIVHRILFAVDGDSTSFLAFIGTILAIGLIFNLLLLVGVTADCAPLMAAWIAEQIFILIFDLSLLAVCTALYYSGNLFLMLFFHIQPLRICFGLYCILIVYRHQHSLYSGPELEHIDVYDVHKSTDETNV
ncbi:hypothetical protein LSTR_LSTR007778 [Laodelphax striatellus]|uniref:Uncharacterized protein n=1 Tax=Laodelphax striatellus TaxID=195883 RepID=A0A482XSM3_LAOST|nr:hypothetical protein LSTR_LSTR007778 [Laodelphax striatellus]